MGGKFIVIEGTDGSGKGVQTELLRKKLTELNIPVEITTEPTTRPIGKLIRSEYLSGNTPMNGIVGAMLYAADRVDHIMDKDNGILMKLQKGINVISDRYYLSSLAYQGIMIGEEKVLEMNKFAMDILSPHVTIFLDLDPLIGMQRLVARGEYVEIFEKLAFQQDVYRSYRNVIDQLRRERTETIFVIDANMSIEDVHSGIWNKIKYLFEEEEN